ncbi:MAG: universal stress protein [Deltaproteobacteria bacterium]|nr:universal stress protein [Deltaproteobacteria bacterium]MBW2301170.1 universal stress protein [Deltaproteobacteria bacterium]
MERVLLAGDGMKPSRKALRFAVDLCKALKVSLSVVQVIDYSQYGKYLKKLRNSSVRVRCLFEGSMMAATFAEAGEHDTGSELMALARKNATDLLREFEGSGIQYSLDVKFGEPSREIVSYVSQHREVVVAIYDASAEDNGEPDRSFAKQTFKRIKERVSVPLVVMHA